MSTTTGACGDAGTGVQPSLALESCCIFLVPNTSSDPDVRRCRAQALRLAAQGGAMVSPRWTRAVTHAVFLSIPVAVDEVSLLKQAGLRGVTFVDFAWLRQSAMSAKMVPTGDFPPPAWGLPVGSGAASLDLSNDNSRLPVPESRVFQGVRIALGPLAMRVSDECPSITAKIIAGRGKVLSHDTTGQVVSGVPTHVVCPPGLSAGELSLVKRMRQQNPRLELVTCCWIDQCIAEHQLLAVSSCSLFVAREFELPLKSFSQKRISLAISGFMGKRPDPDRNRRRDVLSKLAVLLGAEYSERMQRSVSTHLIVESANVSGSEKIKRALEWRIPVVSEKWLVACAATGTLVSTEPYVVAAPPKRESLSSLPPAGKVPETPTRPAQKRRSDTTTGELREGSGAKRKAAKKHASRSATVVDSGSAEALLRRVAANLHKISDVSSGPAGFGEKMGTDNGVGDRNKDAGAGSKQPQRRSRASPGGHEPSSRDGAESGGLRDGGDAFRAEAPVAPASDWSLEATQSQMIVHKDLTPPPVTVVAPKPVPKLRMMPSRAARSRGSLP